MLIAALATLNLGLAVVNARASAPVTYVFTPLVDVIPGGVPLDGTEAAALQTQAKNAVDARDIQQAFARMGSTMSLDDLLRGVEMLDDLTPEQKARISQILADAQARHRDVEAVQREILDLEAGINQSVREIRGAAGGTSTPPTPAATAPAPFPDHPTGPAPHG